MITVTRLFIHPVKSLGGIEVESVEVDALGIVGDRRFMVVDANGRFLTQRTLARMALIKAELRADSLLLRAASSRGRSTFNFQLSTDTSAVPAKVSVWRSENLLADDCGGEAAAWLSDFLGTECRLVRIGEAFRRSMGTDHTGVLSFADAYPALIASEASLDLLNSKLKTQNSKPLPWNRFRPNIVIDGCDPHEEDTWTRVRIGDVIFNAGGPCGRCVVTTTDQKTAERSPEPLRTLALYRRDANEPAQVNFGENYINESKSGTIRVGDPVEIQ